VCTTFHLGDGTTCQDDPLALGMAACKARGLGGAQSVLFVGGSDPSCAPWGTARELEVTCCSNNP
jgi:hypothetical protein